MLDFRAMHVVVEDVYVIIPIFILLHAALREIQQLRCCRRNSGGFFTFSRFLSQNGISVTVIIFGSNVLLGGFRQ